MAPAPGALMFSVYSKSQGEAVIGQAAASYGPTGSLDSELYRRKIIIDSVYSNAPLPLPITIGFS